ncbi:MAG TPA: hypothetical protein VIX12_04900, partial [Candidatus Binataceae bacterium]
TVRQYENPKYVIVAIEFITPISFVGLESFQTLIYSTAYSQAVQKVGTRMMMCNNPILQSVPLNRSSAVNLVLDSTSRTDTAQQPFQRRASRSHHFAKR